MVCATCLSSQTKARTSPLPPIILVTRRRLCKGAREVAKKTSPVRAPAQVDLRAPALVGNTATEALPRPRGRWHRAPCCRQYLVQGPTK